MTRSALRCALWLCLLCTSAASLAFPVMDPASLYGDTADYTITRNGKPVGKHTVVFNREGDSLTVSVESRITVTVLKVPVFRFRYVATESWVDGALVSVDATTTENREATSVSLQSNADESVLTNKDGTEQVARLPIASNHWNPEVLQQSRLFNTIEGSASEVDITAIGAESLILGDQQITAQRYRYQGDIRADVWYDDQGRWVKLAFEGTDGSAIEYLSNGFGDSYQ